MTATNADQFRDFIDGNNDPVIVMVDGVIDLGGSHVSMRSNKTIIGLAGAKFINGGFEFYDDHNVIIRNVTFDAGNIDDALKINKNSHHIWIDHVTMSDYEDGLLDITRGSSHITISWCHFKNHDKVMLIGHADQVSEDRGRLKVSVHHNWFEATTQRHPRVRQGQVHIYNNFFDNVGGSKGYGIASADGADVVIENNFFLNVAKPMQSGVPGYSPPGDIVQRGNLFEGSGDPVNVGSAFNPSSNYSYNLDNANGIPTLVRNGAGVGHIDPQKALQAAK